MNTKKEKRPVADLTRNAILDAATSLFVQQGFAGTSISQIAKQAKVNQSLIYHHFQNKETVWRQVKAELTHHYLREFAGIFEDTTLSGEMLLRKLLRQRIALSLEKPEIRKMILWQHIESNVALRYTPGYEIERWTQLVESLQAKGELRADLAPQIILALMSAQANGLIQSLQELNDSVLSARCIEVAEEMLCNTLLPSSTPIS